VSAAVGFFLEGLRCTGCVNRVERALREAPGVLSASVNYTTHRALVDFDPARTQPAALAARVEQLGYQAIAFDPAALQPASDGRPRDALVRLLVAAFLAGNVMLISLALYFGSAGDLDAPLRRGLRWLAIGLSLPSIGWCALPFWRGAWSGLRRREITLDVPVVLAITTAFAVSAVGTVGEARHLYMDSASMIVFLILLGRTLERGARARAAGAVERLTALAPKTALRRTPAGFQPVEAASLRPGDRVLVPAGQAVAADGVIRRGASELDESLLSGESRPVPRAEGDAVSAGTRNTLAEIEIEVTNAVGAGALSRLAALLERAQAQRPRVQRLADRVAAVFAPVVVALAAATALAGLLSGAAPLDVALRAAAVLIVACPCALGLATPAAITAALGRAAALGVVVKSAEALERCARVDSVLLDKTGTLTDGRFAVEALACAAGVREAELVCAAAEAEGAAIHPIADALRRAAAERGLEPAERMPRMARPGLGVETGEAADRLRVGARALLTRAGVRIAPELDEAAAKLEERALSLAWVARGDAALGVIGLSDPPRADAADAVRRLRALGVRVALVSGDHAPAVGLVARRAGIDDAIARATPEAKVACIAEQRAQGARLLFAGDGINDAAACAAADVGVAMAGGADVTLFAADLVIRSPHLGALADAIALARATLRRIRENLAFALLYNAVAVPLAVAGLLTPLSAAIAMSLSSLGVTANAIRLLRFRPPR
jgi:Cu2+-exporting ATPase